MAERILFAARKPPLPLTSGAALRTHRLLEGLTGEFGVTLLTYAHDERSPDGGVDRDELAASLPALEVVLVPGRGPGKRAAQAAGLLRRRSWEWGRYELPGFAEALAREVERLRPAVVHFDDLGVARYGPVAGTLSAYAPHNVEHRIVRGGAEAGTGLRRAFAAVDWRKVRREEERAWREFDLCLAVSEIDARAFREGGARRVELVPNGADPVEQLPPPVRAAGEPLRVLFVGAGHYQPYERGLAWFVTEVMPLLRERVDAEFDVVGSPPQRRVEAAGVTYRGRVPEVRPWYERAHAVVVPVFEGSGTRLKVVEAAAWGRPIVSTTLGAEGLPLRAGEHWIEANDPESFATALAQVARETETGDERLAARLAAAHTAVSPLFWPAITARLVEIYRGAA